MQTTTQTATATPQADAAQHRLTSELAEGLRASLADLGPACDQVTSQAQALLVTSDSEVPQSATRLRLGMARVNSLLAGIRHRAEEYAAARGDPDARHNVAEFTRLQEAQRQGQAAQADQLRRDLAGATANGGTPGA